MSFAEEVAVKLKNDLKLEVKVIEGYQDKDNLLLEIRSDELIQITAYKRGLTGRKYYLSWAMEFEQAKQYIPLIKKIEFDKEDFNKNPFEYSVLSEGHIAMTLKKKMLWHLVIRETSKIELITVGWVAKAIETFLTKMQKVNSE